MEERYIQLKEYKHIDEIVSYVIEQDLEDNLRAFKIDVRIVGEQYKDKEFTGKTIKKKIELCFN